MPAAPSEPVLRKKTELSCKSRQSGVVRGGAPSGLGPALPTPGALQHPAGLGGGTDLGPQAWEGTGGPWATAGAPIVTASTTASPSFCLEAH